MQLFLIRHTKPQVTAGLCYGQSDIDVAASFVEESEAVQDPDPLPEGEGEN